MSMSVMIESVSFLWLFWKVTYVYVVPHRINSNPIKQNQQKKMEQVKEKQGGRNCRMDRDYST